jgi:type IV secretory pathway VirD2 relaxase
MARTDEEREIRLRPPKPRVRRNEGMAWSSAFRLVMQYARSSRTTVNRATAGGKRESTRPYFQRCAVRVTYLNNKMRGHWKAHGRYLARESARIKDGAKGTGFSREGEGIDIATLLARWQAAGDERLWKLIVSPEFGDRIDLSRLTRDLIGQMETDLGTDLEWLAVEHHNTEHPHVHIAIRGVTTACESLRLSRDYVQHGIRGIAEDRCTRQIGHRTEQDSLEAERREITETRFTSLDRRLLKDAQEISSDLEPEYFPVIRNPIQDGLGETARFHTKHEAARLAVLGRMGLAKPTGPNTWRVRRDFEQVLWAMQRTTDRQRTLAAHGVVMSDERLPIEVLNPAQMTSVEGRVLVHGQDEQTGRNYLMLEGTDAKVYFINYTREMEEARSQGELWTNSFVRLRRLPVDGATILDVNDLGDAEKLLNNPRHFGGAARLLLKRGIMPIEDGWGGWLGRYQATLCKTTRAIEERKERDQDRARQRRRSRSLGR